MKSLLLVSLLVGVCLADEEINPSVRLFATKTYACTTKTVTSLTTSTTTSTSTRVCATTSNITSPSLCRRRRGIEEQPLILAFDEEVAPSAVESVEPSVAATLPEQAAAEAVAQSYPTSIDLSSSQGEENGIVSFDIDGLESACGQQRLFLVPSLTVTFYTVCATTSVVATTVVTATTSTSKAYTLVGCIPSTLTASLC